MQKDEMPSGNDAGTVEWEKASAASCENRTRVREKCKAR